MPFGRGVLLPLAAAHKPSFSLYVERRVAFISSPEKIQTR
jgi:hypothetical protein